MGGNACAKTHVLIVEDSTTQALPIQSVLRRAGYATSLARNGQEGLDMIRASRPTVVLTDLVMPIMDGLTLVRAVHQEFPSLPVILMTGGGNDEIAAEALRAGAASYVSKQKSVQELIEIVERIIVASHTAHSTSFLMGSLDRCLYRFVLRNELPLVAGLTQYVRHLIARMHIFEEPELRNLVVAFEESLLNALYHGNLEVPPGFDKLTRERRLALVQERAQQYPYCERRLHVTLDVSPEIVEFTIRDEGQGFDPSERFDELAARQSTSFVLTHEMRGLLLMHMFMDEVEFNDAGNEVRLLKRRRAPVAA